MQSKQLIISSFQNGDKIKGFYLCKHFQIKISRLGDEYIDLVLEDSSSSIRCKVWSYVDQYKKVLKKNSHVAIKGKVITFNDSLELDISFINLVENNLYDKYGYSKDIILKFSSKQLDKLLEKLTYYISFVEKSYSKPLTKLIEDNKESILKVPSINPKYHFEGGYLVQLVSVLNLNQKTYNLYQYKYSQSILAIILKFIGTLDYYTLDSDFSISDKSMNAGHKILGLKILEKYFTKNTQVVDLIKNIIISNKSNDNSLLNTVESLYEFDSNMNKL